MSLLTCPYPVTNMSSCFNAYVLTYMSDHGRNTLNIKSPLLMIPTTMNVWGVWENIPTDHYA